MLSLLCVKGKEKGDVALKPIKLSISTTFMKWKHLAWGEKQYENKSHVNWYLEQLKNQIPKHLNKLFLVYMRQQCGTDLRERGQDKPTPPTPPPPKILKSWSISPPQNPQKRVTSPYLEMLLHYAPLHSLWQVFPEHCVSLTAVSSQTKGPPSMVSCLSQMPTAAT